MGTPKSRRSSRQGFCRVQLLTLLVAAATLVGVLNLRHARPATHGGARPLLHSKSENDEAKSLGQELASKSQADLRALQYDATTTKGLDLSSATTSGEHKAASFFGRGEAGVLHDGEPDATQSVFGAASGSSIAGSNSGIASASAVDSAVSSAAGREISGDSGRGSAGSGTTANGLATVVRSSLGESSGSGSISRGAIAAGNAGTTNDSGGGSGTKTIKPLGLYFEEDARAAAVVNALAAEGSGASPKGVTSLGASIAELGGGGGAHANSIVSGLGNMLSSADGGVSASSASVHGDGRQAAKKVKPLGLYFEKDARAAAAADTDGSAASAANAVSPSVISGLSTAGVSDSSGSTTGGLDTVNMSGLGATGSNGATRANPLGLYFERDARAAAESPAAELQRLQKVALHKVARRKAQQSGRTGEQALGLYFAADAADVTAQAVQADGASLVPAPVSDSQQAAVLLAAAPESGFNERERQDLDVDSEQEGELQDYESAHAAHLAGQTLRGDPPQPLSEYELEPNPDAHLIQLHRV